MWKLIIPAFLLACPQLTQALETDNYLTWDLELRDSSKKINQFILDQIEEALVKINRKKNSVSCEEASLIIAKEFTTYPPFKMILEDWLVDNLNSDEIYPQDMNYIDQSIYQNTYGSILKWIPLSPNIQVNGYYFGTDKLSHFTSTARRYFDHYLNEMKKGKTEQEAQESSIFFGLKNEFTILGIQTVGVFSYADVEANYQGLLFYKKMCMDSSDTYLKFSKKDGWTLQKTPDIRQFVSPYWDETFYPSLRSKDNWSKTSKIIKSLYCSKESSDLVEKRFSYYKSSTHQSFSLNFIKTLQSQHDPRAPQINEQSFSKLCHSN